MYRISLRNNKSFECSEDDTLVEGARKAGITLEHSCLSGRCSSCKVNVDIGFSEPTTLEISLTEKEKNEGFILSCVRKPKSDMAISAEDLSEYEISIPKTFPVKINNIEKLSDDTIKVELRLPPNQKFNFVPGQYINVIKGNIKRSYSIGNSISYPFLELYIKEYKGGLMSEFWFSDAKINDLLRIEGPRGTFFLREKPTVQNIIFLATGTGIAPVKSILETTFQKTIGFGNKKVYLFWGNRFSKDFFWDPREINKSINYFPVLSRDENSLVDRGYIQDVLISKGLNLEQTIVYACGSDKMIQEAKQKLFKKGLPEENFFSDAFVISN